ncbi:MAG: C39 family peptidase [Candidatus Halalkalibacterium sp. M3_1C_030]
MKAAIPLEILPQPDDSTCGPTGLHTVYNYYGDEISLQQVIDEVEYLQNGGTLGSMLANHALERGYKVTIYTYNLNIFDPTWFGHEQFFIKNKLELQSQYKQDAKLHTASKAYSKFLGQGGIIKYEVLKASLIRKYLNKGIPILTGLSSTFLYGSMREHGDNMDYDDLRGEPSGHFVVLNGYDKSRRTVSIADPLHSNPMGEGPIYETGIDRLINAILLGIVTYDANLIVITPDSEK